MEKFKYLGVTVTNINDIRDEIECRVNMGNACYYSPEKILPSRLLSKKLKVKTCNGRQNSPSSGYIYPEHNTD